MKPHVDAGGGDSAGERVPGAAAEQRRRAERRGRVPGRERAGDRPVQSVGELDIGVLAGPKPPEHGFHRAVGEKRLGPHRGGESGGVLHVAAARDCDGCSAHVPEQAVVGRAREPVRDTVDGGTANLVERAVDGGVESNDLRAHRIRLEPLRWRAGVAVDPRGRLGAPASRAWLHPDRRRRQGRTP